MHVHGTTAVRRAGPRTLAISDSGVHAVLELKVEDVHRRAPLGGGYPWK